MEPRIGSELFDREACEHDTAIRKCVLRRRTIPGIRNSWIANFCEVFYFCQGLHA
jgi:hypothetical protein